MSKTVSGKVEVESVGVRRANCEGVHSLGRRKETAVSRLFVQRLESFRLARAAVRQRAGVDRWSAVYVASADNNDDVVFLLPASRAVSPVG